MPVSSRPQTRRFLLCSADDGLAAAALRAVDRACVLAQEADLSRVEARLADFDPHVVFIDFQPDPAYPDKLAQAADLVRRVRRAAPELPLVALGVQDEPQGPLAALRAGVQDFIDPFVEPAEMLAVAERVGAPGSPARAAVRSLGLLGVRPGVGCSLLAAHLGHLLQRRPAGAEHGTMLCDLGWPIGDGQLYLHIGRAELDFAQAVQNLDRIDRTLARTAFATGAGGVAVLPLPEDLDAMQSVSHAGALALLDTLTEHFGTVLVDLGGFPHVDFVSRVAAHTDQAWLVTDQSVGALVSLAQLLRELDERKVPRERLRLVVNRYNPEFGMSAEQIAQRFGVRLLGVVPERTRALMAATSQGELLTASAEHDAYVRAVQGLLDTAWPQAPGERARTGWLQRLFSGERLRGAGKSRSSNI